MKFGKSIGTQQEDHADFHYMEYKVLKKKIKDVVARLQASELAEALTANTAFEEELAAEIGRVNQCFSHIQMDLLARTSQLSEELQQRQQEQGCAANADAGSMASTRADALRRLVDILQEVDQLRKYAVWNAVAVVKILKKRRKQTSFGIEDTAAERAGWLSRQTFFSGSDFAELHASIESLGHMLVLSEIVQKEHAAGALRSQSNQEPQQCPICLDAISDMVELSCKHRFCWKCFVLGPIAFQPGEYRITQCPICRRETTQSLEAGSAEDSPACRLPSITRGSPFKAAGADPHGMPQPTQEGILTRFLHTYFPGEADADGPAEKEGLNRLDVQEEDVGELVKVLLADCQALQQRPAAGSSSSTGQAESGSVPSDFFETLPRPNQEKPLQAAQKLQWLQLAWAGDPLALDDNQYCALCSEPLMMEAVLCTPCKHHFHRVCITRIDKPQCPICSTQLPFSWFLPPNHPCTEHGFRTVEPRSYKPIFAGGPGKGNCGYPLQRPPPAALTGPENMSMRSYLHRLIPTGVDVGEEEDPTPKHDEEVLAPLRGPCQEQHVDDDETSSEESNSEEDDEDMTHQVHTSSARAGSRSPPVYVYGAVGRMKLLGRNRQRTFSKGSKASDDEADLPTRYPVARSCSSEAASMNEDAERSKSKVLLIGDYL
mmetsp:Transcript_72959/g.170974  ORF Transcript_72959/g.170974 Transcript_72959/m.170974 type:complete len:660 (-) Transcript_72959:98-2077(-)